MFYFSIVIFIYHAKKSCKRWFVRLLLDALRLDVECQSIDDEKKFGIGGIVYYSIYRLYQSFSWLIIANIITVSRRNSAESLMGTTTFEHSAEMICS